MADVKVRIVSDKGLKASALTEVYINDFKVPGLRPGTTAEVVFHPDLHQTVLTLRFAGNVLALEEISPEMRGRILVAQETEHRRIAALAPGTPIDALRDAPAALEQ